MWWQIKMRAIAIPILLSFFTFVNFALCEVSSSTSSAPTLSSSPFDNVNESLPRDVDILDFYRRLLNLYETRDGYGKLKTFFEKNIGGHATSPLSDADYKTLIKVVKATRDELKSGDNSLSSLNMIIWLTSYSSEVGEEILKLIRVLNEHPKEVFFGLTDLAMDLAFQRLPRQRRPSREPSRRRRNATEGLIKGIERVSAYLHLLRFELRGIHVDNMEKLQYDSLLDGMNSIMVHNLNEFYVEVKQSHLSDVVVFLKSRFDLTMKNVHFLLEEAKMNQNDMVRWEGHTQVVVEKIFGQVVEILALEERGDIRVNQTSTTAVPQQMLTEEQFLSEVRMLHQKVLPFLKREFNDPEKISSILNETSTNLTQSLLKSVPEKINSSSLTSALSTFTSRIKEDLQKALQVPVANIFDGENAKFEGICDRLQRELEGIIEIVRRRYQETKSDDSVPIDKKVLEFIKNHGTLKPVLRNRHKVVEQIAWTHELIGDYQFQEMTDYFDVFWGTEILNNESILRIENPQQLAKILSKIRERLEESGALVAPNFNFLQHLQHFEMDSEESLELVEALRELVSESTTSASMSKVVRDLANADFVHSTDAKLTKSLEHYYENQTTWNQTVIHESFKKFEHLQKKVKSPRSFKKFLRSFGTLLANRLVYKKDFSVFASHFFEKKPQVLKCSEILNLLKCGARLLKSFDNDMKKVLTNLEIFSHSESKTFESVDRIRQKLDSAYSMLPYFLRIYANDTIKTRALFKVSRVAYDMDDSRKVVDLLKRIETIDTVTFVGSLQFLTSRANPYTSFAQQVAQAIKDQSLGSIALHETFGIHQSANSSFADILHWYEQLVDLVNDDVALADWITSLHQVAVTSQMSLAEYAKALGTVLSETKKWTPIQKAHEEINEIFGEKSLNRSEFFAPFSNLNVSSTEKMEEVVAAYQRLAGAPGIAVLREFLSEYTESPDSLLSTLEYMGVHPNEYQRWSQITEHFDDIVDLLVLAKSHSNLQRLLNTHHFLMDSDDVEATKQALRLFISYLEVPKTSSMMDVGFSTSAPSNGTSYLFDLPVRFLQIANIGGEIKSDADLSSLKEMWASLVKIYGPEMVMSALGLGKVNSMLELLSALTNMKKDT